MREPNLPSPVLRRLFVYPVKSARGIEVDRAEVDALGLRHDRRWMAVDAEGRFLSQRTVPRMAVIETAIDGERLRLTAPDAAPLALPLEPDGVARASVIVWEDAVDAVAAGEEADRWLSRVLGLPARLVGFPAGAVRSARRDPAGSGTRIGFADAYPFLLVSEESLAALNARLEEPLPMDRFRPNLVVGGAGAFGEDAWVRFRIGELAFDAAGPCSRCSTTTVDQATGERGEEPLRTLSTFRRSGSKVLFGMNVVHRGAGELRTGTPVEIVEEAGG